METEIIIAGDICPIGNNTELFQRGDAPQLLRGFKSVFDNADLIVANLECPLVDSATPKLKSGPNLAVPSDCINGLEAIGIDAIGLANNHIMDYGLEGLISTTQLLSKSGIDYVGAGDNIQTAGKIISIDVNGLRVGVYAAAEHEFGIASQHQAGANPLNVINAARDIKNNRHRYDRLIVLIHGGNEHFPFPRPGLQKTCRFLVEIGADIIVCQHSHITGCAESYMGAQIIYGQGNFLFDMASSYDSWRIGCLIKVSFGNDHDQKVEFLPFAQPLDGGGIEQLSEMDEKKWFAEFEERSSYLDDQGYLTEKWIEYYQSQKTYYFNVMFGRFSHIRRFLKRIGLIKWIDPEKTQLARLNMIRCESHREVLLRILESEVPN